MFINPSIDFMTKRAMAIAAILTDTEKDPAQSLSVRQVVALTQEYDQLRAAMRSMVVAALPESTLWEWYVTQQRLRPGHNAQDLVNNQASV